MSYCKMIRLAYTGTDPSSLGVMRFLFGLLMLLDIPQERGMSFLHTKWSDPEACHFPLFNSLMPLPLEWMYMVYMAMFMAAIGIMLGFMYRLSCICFVLTYWYIFFLDKTTWNNHSYLYGLVGIMLLMTDADHYLSLDSILRPKIRNLDVPRWHYGIFKFQMFSIGMFPWTMLGTMPIFCHPDWPKKLIHRLPMALQGLLPTTKTSKANVICSNAEKQRVPKLQLFTIVIACLYVLGQLVLPYSHSITKGYNAWTQGLYGYSWDMMVHSWNTQHVVIKVVDNSTGDATYLRPDAFINGRRIRRWNSHPDMIKQYALCVADRIKRTPELGIRDPKIYIDVWRSLNKRFQQRLIDPSVDLVAAPWSPFQETKWIRPLLTGLTPWREKLHEIRSQTYQRSNISDVTFVADFPGLYLENFIDEDVVANLTVLYGSVNVNINNLNTTAFVNDTIQLPSNTTHVVYVSSETPACYMYESYNVTLQDGNSSSEDVDDEYSRKLKEEQEWLSKAPMEKFRTFLGRKFTLFKISFTNAARSFALIISRYLRKEDGSEHPM